MKNLKLYPLSLLLVCCAPHLALAMDYPCGSDEKKPLDTKNKAIACLQWRVNNNTNSLFNYASNSDHTCNVAQCANYTSKDGPSCFSDNKPTFLNTLSNTTIDECEVNQSNSNAWSCWGTTTGSDGCYMQPGGIQKGILSKRIYFSINNAMTPKYPKNNIITFYPTGQ